jgi:hypothetical protein
MVLDLSRNDPGAYPPLDPLAYLFQPLGPVLDEQRMVQMIGSDCLHCHFVDFLVRDVGGGTDAAVVSKRCRMR